LPNRQISANQNLPSFVRSQVTAFPLAVQRQYFDSGRLTSDIGVVVC
jgi:hypothetical protein